MARPKPKPKLYLGGPWQAQLAMWVRDHPGPLPFSVEAFDRAYDIAVTLAGMPDMPAHASRVTVRQVISMTEPELLALKGVGHQTMKLVKTFLRDHGITELGPVHKAKPPSILAKEAARLMTDLDDPDVVPPGPPIGHEAISMPDFDERRRL